MIRLSAFGIFFWYILCFTSTLCDQLESNFQTVNQQLIAEGLDYGAKYLDDALVAASSGKNVFRMPNSLSEDCQRTAKAMMILLAKPSLYGKIRTIQSVGSFVTVSSLQRDQNPVEIFCKNINEMMNESRSDFPDFEKLKKNVQLSTNSKNYFLEIPTDQDVKNSLAAWSSKFNQTEFLRFAAIRHFHSLEMAELDRGHQEFKGVSRAIHQLAKSLVFKSIVDNLFTQALDDYIKNLLTKNTNTEEKEAAIHDFSFAKKVDEYFVKNSVITEEYQKIKKEAK